MRQTVRNIIIATVGCVAIAAAGFARADTYFCEDCEGAKTQTPYVWWGDANGKARLTTEKAFSGKRSVLIETGPAYWEIPLPKSLKWDRNDPRASATVRCIFPCGCTRYRAGPSRAPAFGLASCLSDIHRLAAHLSPIRPGKCGRPDRPVALAVRRRRTGAARVGSERRVQRRSYRFRKRVVLYVLRRQVLSGRSKAVDRAA